ncbi:MAG: polysaccharide deacetylase family protein [candidate division KSB1 bacterium]|nr:polysaccharide deacetylase family protein [candidate division KSB1 bacterium]
MYRIPCIVTKLIPWSAWRGPRMEEVYLTFDDGPDPHGTPLILDLLEAHGCLATFFVLGCRAAAHPQLVRRLLQAGHGLGTHSFAHTRLGHLSSAAIVEDIRRTDEAVAALVGRVPRCFRPPYGSVSPALFKAAAATEKRVVLWSLSSGDYLPRLDPERLAHRLLRKVRGGDIVLFHDGHANAPRTARVLELLLPQLQARGLRPNALPIALPGKWLAMQEKGP